MKELAASILLLVYFTVTTGFVVSVHYCMNKLQSVDLGYTAKEECGKCGMNIVKSEGCCKDEVKVVKLHTVHQASNLAVPDFALALLPKPVSVFERPAFSLPQNFVLPSAHGPPLPTETLYLRNRVFRI